MAYQSSIRKTYSLLFPTGRAWQYTRASEDREGIVEPYTDGFGQIYTDGIGQPYTTNIAQFIATDGKRFTDAKLKAYDRAYADTKSILNTILPDNSEFDETDADRWEMTLLIEKNLSNLEERKQRILRRLTYPNNVLERSHYQFIENQIRAAGFDVYITENRFWNGMEYEIVDPDTIGTQQMELGLPELGVNELDGTIAGVDYTGIIANYIDDSIDNAFFTAPTTTPLELGDFELGDAELGEGGAIGLSREIQLQASFFIGGKSFPSIVMFRQIERMN